jgi:xylulokinase
MDMVIGGLDVGSTGCKITLYDENGRLLHAGYKDYPVQRESDGHLINAEDIWAVVRQLIQEAAQREPRLTGIGVTSFGESFVLLDENDRVLFPSMLYTDPHGEEEAAELCSRISRDEIAAISGALPHAMYSLPKLMWLKKHEPDVYRRATRVCLIQDYIVYMLTGRAQIDYSLASRTLAFDIKRLVWSDTLLDAAGIDRTLLSRPVPPGTSAGAIRASLAGELGIPRSIEIVSCCHDQVSATVGAGVLQAGMAVDGTGTVECLTPLFDGIPDNFEMQRNNIAIAPHAIPGKYVGYAFSFTGGATVKWYIDHLAGYEKSASAHSGLSVYEQLEAGMKDGPTGLLVLPHFAGAATPYMDYGSKGGIIGLTLSTMGADIYKALMEGVVFELAVNVDILRDAGVRIDRLNATGGCTLSGVWMQMKADILNIPITRMRDKEAGTIGGILLTGVSLGAFAGLAEAAEKLVIPCETYLPREKYHEKYTKIYQRYKRLYTAVRPLV